MPLSMYSTALGNQVSLFCTGAGANSELLRPCSASRLGGGDGTEGGRNDGLAISVKGLGRGYQNPFHGGGKET